MKSENGFSLAIASQPFYFFPSKQLLILEAVAILACYAEIRQLAWASQIRPLHLNPSTVGYTGLNPQK